MSKLLLHFTGRGSEVVNIRFNYPAHFFNNHLNRSAPARISAYTRMRVWPSARRLRRQATACAGPPPKRQAEPRSGEGVRPLKRSGANSKRLTSVASVSANPNQVRVQHLTKLEMSSPDLSEVRVQRLTSVASVSANPNQVRVQRRASVQCVSANPNEVRVRPHKESGANSKRLTLAASVSANPNQVRVRGHSSPLPAPRFLLPASRFLLPVSRSPLPASRFTLPAPRYRLFAVSGCRFYCRFPLPLLVAVWQGQIPAWHNLAATVHRRRGGRS